ncbi:hypothetical protein [Pseudomonas sp. RIT-PI-AD]|uniref:hypothetical protein n=1 Tax=Pseudomonas sp. RIT-PI-AD TaxID=3035294 RepID=UPI0021D86707|nr:hypothetical protein [Pseudomonas sp. RIT-PI-AD]
MQQCEQRFQRNRLGDQAVAFVVGMQVVAGVEIGTQTLRVVRVAQQHVEVDDGGEFLGIRHQALTCCRTAFF